MYCCWDVDGGSDAVLADYCSHLHGALDSIARAASHRESNECRLGDNSGRQRRFVYVRGWSLTYRCAIACVRLRGNVETVEYGSDVHSSSVRGVGVD